MGWGGKSDVGAWSLRRDRPAWVRCLPDGFQTASVQECLRAGALQFGGGVHGADGKKPKTQCARFVLGTFPGQAHYSGKERDGSFSFFYISLPSDCVISVAKSQN